MACINHNVEPVTSWEVSFGASFRFTTSFWAVSNYWKKFDKKILLTILMLVNVEIRFQASGRFKVGDQTY